MFTYFWLVWATIGLIGAIILFRWSLKTRQFQDSRRAALLPFDDEAPAESGEKARNPRLFLTVAVIMGFGIVTAIILLLQAFSF